MTPRRTIVVTDYSFPDLALETAVLAQGDCDIVGHHCSTEAELIAAVANADAVITQFAKINANVIAAMTRARAIVRYLTTDDAGSGFTGPSRRLAEATGGGTTGCTDPPL